MTDIELKKQFSKIEQRFTQIEQRFDEVDQRFIKIDEKFAKIDETFAKLFVYMEKRFAVLEAKIDTKADADQTYKALDMIIKRLEAGDQERVFMNHQLARHEGWIGQLAEATQTKLAPKR